MILKTEKTTVKSICDCLWGKNECPNPAAFLTKHKTSKMYSIMCEVHQAQFAEIYPNAPVEYHEWSAELNRRFAEEASNGN